jgi:hypothetical protein
MREILPGVHHWTALREGIGVHVSSYYVEPAGVVIDPMVPEEGLGVFAGLKKPQQVVLTSGLHTRCTVAFADAFGCVIRAPREAASRLDGMLEFEPYSKGDEIAPAVTDDPPAVKRALTRAFEALLADHEFDHLLFAHGGPVIGGGKAALRAFIKQQH